ncbi:MAG: NepR family anti-sigma factor [Pseudomonadota bacterium]
MTSENDPKQKRIDQYIDQNLKRVFADLEKDEMPDQILDLLMVLRAQDAEKKDEK